MAMTRPIAASKVLLVADRRVASAEAGSTPLRRYRLARVRYDGRPIGRATRFEQVKA